jgi:hypothetical protein
MTAGDRVFDVMLELQDVRDTLEREGYDVKDLDELTQAALEVVSRLNEEGL